MEKSREILRKYWGFEQFRNSQESIIDDVINGFDSLALLPTGGGKSICFQVPGLAREGLTLVISPLISLMQDQVANLTKRGLRAQAIVSGMNYREIDLILDNARFGGLDFLYTSPERIQSKLFVERFKRMSIGLIVIDEAHCISEWGHDFRPSFLKIAELREYHPNVPLIALTATATEPVRKDIIEQLQLKNVKIHEASFERKNLSYEAYQARNKASDILKYCINHSNDSGIIYCQTRKSVKEIASLLRANSISCGIYHGGMNAEDRKKMLELWLKGEIKVISATNAFGMGIDKPDVRFVLHYEFPPSLEAYFQEAGRAGRDGERAKAITYWEEFDLKILEEKVKAQFPESTTIKLIYRALCSYLKIAIGSGKDETYPIDIRLFCENYKIDALEVYHSLKILEMNGDLSFSEGVFHPTKVKFSVGVKELYNFQIAHSKYVGLTTLLSRSYPGIFDLFFEVNEKEFSKRLAINETALKQQLMELEKYGILDVSWSTALPTVTFLHERLPDDYLSLSDKVYSVRKENALRKVMFSVNFLKNVSCRSVQLLSYFGQDSNVCGNCDVCLAKSRKSTNETTSKESILEFLSSPQKLDAIVENYKNDWPKTEQLLKALILNGEVSETTENQFKTIKK